MRLRLLFFMLVASLLLTAQTDTTAHVLKSISDYNDIRIGNLEESFYNLLIFNIIVNVLLVLGFFYLLLSEFDVSAILRKWLGGNSKASIRGGNGRAEQKP